MKRNDSKKLKDEGNGRVIYPSMYNEWQNNYNNGGKKTNFEFCDNTVITSKYTSYNFLIKNLWEQFHRVANCYFLFIAILQQIPGVSPTGQYTTIAPLTLVMAVTAIKEAYEDIGRHEADKKTNNKRTTKVENGEYREVSWQDVQVGDILYLTNCPVAVPADVIILSTSEPDNICYIETANLDGEVNLKIRQGLKQTAHINTPEKVQQYQGHIVSENPNSNLHKYEGSLFIDQSELSINMKQFLPRGSNLKNTTFAYCLVVFTGSDTKLMMNSNTPPLKRTDVERITNTAILYILLFELLLCLIGLIGGIIWTNSYEDTYWYLPKVSNSFYNILMNFFTFLILYNNLVPISLYVTIEMVKVAQAYFIDNDLGMYYDGNGKDVPAKARTSNLNEELGQIEYIFSDKTGTLTCNRMDFLRCSIAGYPFGGKNEDDTLVRIATTPADTKNSLEQKTAYFFDELLRAEMNNNNNNNSDKQLKRAIDEFYTCLAVCHTVIPERRQSPTPPYLEVYNYQASSPDEGALVFHAKSIGYTFYERQSDSVTIIAPDGERKYELLNTLEFNSDRKRMSVIVRCPDGKIRIYCKGADMMILARLATNQKELVEKTNQHLEFFGAFGLRTLCLASAELSEETYSEWFSMYHAASVSLVNRDGMIDSVAEKIEVNLTLLGATAIEDKLQDGVPQAIQNLLEANCKVWVLTGDKQETAINIGYACGLLNPNFELLILNSTKEKELLKSIESKLVAMLKEDGQIVATQQGLELASLGNDNNINNNNYNDDGLKVMSNVNDLGDDSDDGLLEKLKRIPLKDLAKVLGGALSSYALVIDGPTLTLALADSVNLTSSSTNGDGKDNNDKSNYSSLTTALANCLQSLRGDENDTKNNGNNRISMNNNSNRNGGLPQSSSSSLPSDVKAGEISTQFLRLALLCKSVICCRVSPKQKAQVVALVKNNCGALTLSIGDGANDVSMIQTAHIGVGISGEEGMQAVFASDYAIGQFRFLTRLLFLHGRLAYVRTSKVILYSFYKNAALYLCQFWFTWVTAQSGQTMFESWTLSVYNVFFTSLPIIAVGALDSDLSFSLIMDNPNLYTLGHKQYYLSMTSFAEWMINAVAHSFLCYAIVMFAFADETYNNGRTPGLWEMGTVIYNAVLLVVTVKLALIVSSWTIFHKLTFLFSVVAWLIFLVIYSYCYLTPFQLGPDMFGIYLILFPSAILHLTGVLAIAVCLLRDFTWKYVKRIYFKEIYHIIQDIELDKKKVKLGFDKPLVVVAKGGKKKKRHLGFAFSGGSRDDDLEYANRHIATHDDGDIVVVDGEDKNDTNNNNNSNDNDNEGKGSVRVTKSVTSSLSSSSSSSSHRKDEKVLQSTFLTRL